MLAERSVVWDGTRGSWLVDWRWRVLWHGYIVAASGSEDHQEDHRRNPEFPLRFHLRYFVHHPDAGGGRAM
jgi:hypothetical protein